MKLKVEEIKTYNITLIMEADYVKALYEKLMYNLDYPAHFWEGKSPSDEVEEFLKNLQVVYKKAKED